MRAGPQYANIQRCPRSRPSGRTEGNVEPMSMPVEVRLRVPNMKARVLDENGYPIDHSSMRFRKVIEVPKIPKRLLSAATRVACAI